MSDSPQLNQQPAPPDPLPPAADPNADNTPGLRWRAEIMAIRTPVTLRHLLHKSWGKPEPSKCILRVIEMKFGAKGQHSLIMLTLNHVPVGLDSYSSVLDAVRHAKSEYFTLEQQNA